MLTVNVNSQGTVRQYDSELVELSYVVSNNEEVPVSASVPTLNATVKFATYDAFLANLKRGDVLSFFDPSYEGSGLVLYLHVIEVSALKARRVVEVGCTGDFISDSNEIIGIINVPESIPQNLDKLFQLSVLDNYENNPHFIANVKTKADLILALAWAQNTRRNIALTPFTTGAGDRFKNSGVALFPNVKETDVYHEFAPVYRIKAEDIIDYEVSPAQPPVTHLSAASVGNQIETTIDPIVSRVKYTSSGAKFKAFYIQDSTFGAVQDSTLGVQSNANVLFNLYWSDGTVTRNITGITVLGITTRGYVVLEKVDTSYRIVYYDKDGGVINSMDVQQLNPVSMVGHQGKIVQEVYIEGSAGGGATYFYFDTVQRQDTYVALFVGLKISDDGSMTKMLLQQPTFLSSGLEFKLCGVCKVEMPDGTYGASAAYGKYIEVIGYAGSYNLDLCQITYNNEGTRIQTLLGLWAYRPDDPDFALDEQKFTPMTFFSTYPTPTVDKPAYLVGSLFHYDQNGTAEVMIVKLSSGSLPVNNSVEQGDYYSAVAVLPTGGVFHSLDETYILTYSHERYFNNPEQWILMRIQFNDNGWNANTWFVQQGYISDFLAALQATKSNTVNDWITLATGAMAFELSRTDAVGDYREIYFTISPVGFLQRKGFKFLNPQRIAVGLSNIVELPFKIGMLTQSDMNSWDIDLGRIEIRLSRFQVRNNSTGEWIDKSVQGLNVMAIGAYVRVWLDPDSSDFITVKVLSFSIKYTGVVKATVTGMIVPN